MSWRVPNKSLDRSMARRCFPGRSIWREHLRTERCSFIQPTVSTGCLQKRAVNLKIMQPYNQEQRCQSFLPLLKRISVYYRFPMAMTSVGLIFAPDPLQTETIPKVPSNSRSRNLATLLLWFFGDIEKQVRSVCIEHSYLENLIFFIHALVLSASFTTSNGPSVNSPGCQTTLGARVPGLRSRCSDCANSSSAQ